MHLSPKNPGTELKHPRDLMPSISHCKERDNAADYFEYVITVEKEGMQPHTIKTTDITMPSTLKPLINFLINKQRTMSAK